MINEQWAHFFKDLYTPSENPSFCNEKRSEIIGEFNDIMSKLPSDTSSFNHVTLEEFRKVCDSAKRNKACGPDGCFYENFKFCSDILSITCVRLFNAMLRYSYFPNVLKRGEIIVIHKGGNKSQTDPNNYRAITLSSVILKLYESIILTRMQECSFKISKLQGGFQKGISCLMTSFLFRECNSYVCENGSKLYTCFLDVKQAFDRVWHEALMVKLYHTNIDVYLFKSILRVLPTFVYKKLPSVFKSIL